MNKLLERQLKIKIIKKNQPKYLFEKKISKTGLFIEIENF